MDKRADLGKKFQDVLENQEIPHKERHQLRAEAEEDDSGDDDTAPKPFPAECADAVKALLTSSWKDIHNEYDKLTSEEQKCLTREQHAKLVKWITS